MKQISRNPFEFRARVMTALRTRIETALAEHDAMIADCPVNNPKYGRAFGPNDRCPRCKAKASGSCGLSSTAGYHLAIAVRSALEADDGGVAA